MYMCALSTHRSHTRSHIITRRPLPPPWSWPDGWCWFADILHMQSGSMFTWYTILCLFGDGRRINDNGKFGSCCVVWLSFGTNTNVGKAVALNGEWKIMIGTCEWDKIGEWRVGVQLVNMLKTFAGACKSIKRIFVEFLLDYLFR